MTVTNQSAVDMIERAHTAQPYCACGRHTTPVWRDGAVWLECSVLVEHESSLQRLMIAVFAPAHTHTHIVDLA